MTQAKGEAIDSRKDDICDHLLMAEEKLWEKWVLMDVVLGEQAEISKKQFLSDLRAYLDEEKNLWSIAKEQYETSEKYEEAIRLDERKKWQELFEKNKVCYSCDGRQPMGVSQWKAHGETYGYWDYFKKELLKEIEAKAPQDLLEPRTVEGECGKFEPSDEDKVIVDVFNRLNAKWRGILKEILG